MDKNVSEILLYSEQTVIDPVQAIAAIPSCHRAARSWLSATSRSRCFAPATSTNTVAAEGKS